MKKPLESISLPKSLLSRTAAAFLLGAVLTAPAAKADPLDSNALMSVPPQQAVPPAPRGAKSSGAQSPAAQDSSSAPIVERNGEQVQVTIPHFAYSGSAHAAPGGASPVPAQPYRDPVTGYRRTLYMSVGQHQVVFEAPVGMCFLDQSDYLQNTVLRYITEKANENDGQIIATFADCMELSKMQNQFQEDSLAAAKSNSTDDVQPDASLMPRSGGTISWQNPDNADNDEQVVLSREQYLDLREKDFRDDVVKANTPKSGHGKMTAVSFMSPAGPTQFDDKARRTKDGLALAYSKDEEIEYQNLHTIAVVGTTLLHQIPLEITFTFTTKDAPQKDFKALYAMMDSFLAQQVLMNQKIKTSF